MTMTDFSPTHSEFMSLRQSLSSRSGGRIRHFGLLFLVISSLLIAISIGQFETISRGSLRYLILIGVAALLPLFDLPEILKTLLGRAKLLLFFLLLAGAWSIVAGDWRAAYQLGLLVLVLAWISIDRARIDVRDIVWVYLGIIVVAVSMTMLTDLNGYNLIPHGSADPEISGGKVSFAPNIAYTAFLSLAMLMILTRSSETARSYLPIVAIASYFIFFSFVRTAFVALALYAFLYWWFSHLSKLRSVMMFWTALLVAIGLNLAILLAADVLYVTQSIAAVSDMFLRGESGLTKAEILYQLYRPWLWTTQVKLFLSSPYLMGWGSVDFAQLAIPYSPPQITTGSESLPLRLLIVYGLASLLFIGYFISRLWSLAQRGDRWACACFPPVVVLMMNWGSTFHPADAMFILFVMMIVRGSDGYRISSTACSEPLTKSQKADIHVAYD